jgi:hypothetical protein
LFYVAVPIIFWTVLGTNLFERWVRRHTAMAATVTALIVLAWVVIVIQPASGSLHDGSDVGIAYNSMDQLLDPDAAIALSFTEHNDWAVTVGILEQAHRDGRSACVRVGPGVFEIVFTAENICAENAGDPIDVLVTALAGPPDPQAVRLFDGDNYDVWSLDG